jgi:WD40 repeat protein
VAFTIQDKSEAAFPAQAGLFQTDIDILVAADDGTKVRYGCAVTAQGSPNMTVAVAAGAVEVAGVVVAVAAGNVTITNADATNPRFDLIVVSNTGVKSAVAGTPAAYVEGTSTPLVPALPANSVALATVYVPAGDTAIASNQIVDKRVMDTASTAPDLVSELATDFIEKDPISLMVLQGSFVATTTKPRIDVEIQGSATGIMHAPFILLVGPGIAFPLHQGTVAGAKAGVEEFSLGAIAGEYVRNSLTASVYPTGVSVGQTVRWEVYTAISGYANELTGFINGNIAPRVTPDGTKLYVLNTTRVVPIAVGRSLENVYDTAIAGEFLPAIPHVFTTAFDMCFKPDGSRGYVADWFGAAVVVIDVLTDRVLTSIPGNTTSVACTADGSKVFVAAGSGAGNIRIIDTTTHAVTTQSTAATDAAAAWVRFSPDGTKLAVYMSGGGGTTNRVYVYTTGTNGSTWTLTATCVIGGATHQATSLAWEGNDVVWVPLSAHNAVYRCVVSTQTVTSFTHVGASGVRVSSNGLGKTLFVASASSTTNCMAYYVLPSTAGVAPTKYDGWNSYPFYDVELSHDNFIYEGSSGTVLMLHQGGIINIMAGALAGFWNDYCRVKVFGGV